MKNGDLVTTDLRPLFIRALEEGYKQNLLEGSTLERIKKDGAALTVSFAERFYNKFYESYLIQAMHSVVGILSLGLYFITNNNFDLVVKTVAKESLLNIFRIGWTKIVELRKLKNSLEDSRAAEEEKSIAESLSSPPEGPWPGIGEYNNIQRRYEKKTQEKSYHQWMKQKYFRELDPREDYPDGQVNRYNAEVNTDSFYMSLAIKTEPFSPLTYEDIRNTYESLRAKEGEKKFRSRLDNFPGQVPSPWKEVAAWEVKKFWGHIGKEICSYAKKNMLSELAHNFSINFLDDVETNEYVKELYASHRESVKRKSVRQLLEILKGASGLKLDASLRLATVNELLERKTISVATIKTILTFADREDWLGKIRWSDFPARQILKTIRQDEVVEIQNFVLRDVFLSSLDASDKWWSNFPIGLVDLAFKEAAEARSLIIKKAKHSWKEIEKKANSGIVLPHYAFLIGRENWYDAWTNGIGKELLPELILRANEFLSWSRKVAVQNLYDICTGLIAKYRANEDADLMAKPPFYVSGLEEVLTKVLQPAELKIFKKNLSSLKKSNLSKR